MSRISLSGISLSRISLPVCLALVLMAGLAAEARASLMINTPAGISGGQSFIVVVFDDARSGVAGTGSYTSISTYNSDINTDLSGISYSKGTFTSWQILGATATADPAATVFGSSLPIYDDKGDKLGASGSAWLASGYTPNYDQNGTKTSGRPTWTGLYGEYGNPGNAPNGSPATGYTLGSTQVESGNNNQELSLGGLDGNGPTSSSLYGNYYGWAVFTVTPTPEPGTLTLSLVGLAAVGAGRWVRRRRPARS